VQGEALRQPDHLAHHAFSALPAERLLDAFAYLVTHLHRPGGDLDRIDVDPNGQWYRRQ